MVTEKKQVSRPCLLLRQEFGEPKLWEPNYSKLEQQYMAAARSPLGYWKLRETNHPHIQVSKASGSTRGVRLDLSV